MKNLLILAVALLFLSGCEEQAPSIDPPIRAVKTMVLSKFSTTSSRELSGIVKTSDSAALSFRVSGRVTAVKVRAGQTVAMGQILATLDQQTYRLVIDKAQANLADARAVLKEKQEALARQKKLKEKDFASQAAVEKAQAEFEAAKSKVSVARASLRTAENDLDYTVLRAPFPGKVDKRAVDAFVDIKAGATVFELLSDEIYKVEVLMPETLIREVSNGDIVQVSLPTLKETQVGGTVSSIGARAETGNAFPVEIQLEQNPLDIRAGMTAQVTFNYDQGFDGDKSPSGPIYLIPVTALDLRVSEKILDISDKKVPVFIFDPAEQVVQKRIVTIRDVRGNELEVTKGLSEGDILIIAGIPYLTEGQKVKQWKPSYNLPAKLNYQQ